MNSSTHAVLDRECAVAEANARFSARWSEGFHQGDPARARRVDRLHDQFARKFPDVGANFVEVASVNPCGVVESRRDLKLTKDVFAGEDAGNVAGRAGKTKFRADVRQCGNRHVRSHGEDAVDAQPACVEENPRGVRSAAFERFVGQAMTRVLKVVIDRYDVVAELARAPNRRNLEGTRPENHQTSADRHVSQCAFRRTGEVRRDVR